MKFYHNPRCSKSRKALQLLREHGVEPDIVEYLNSPPSLDTLKKLLNSLGLSAKDIVRTKEAEYKLAGLGPDSPDDAILEAIARYPKLLERPIAVEGQRAVIGRPPERVLELLP